MPLSVLDVVRTDVLGNAAGFAAATLVFTGCGPAARSCRGRRDPRWSRPARAVWPSEVSSRSLSTASSSSFSRRSTTFDPSLRRPAERSLVDHTVDGSHGTHLHHHLDDFNALDGHLVGESSATVWFSPMTTSRLTGRRLVEPLFHGVRHGILPRLPFARMRIAGSCGHGRGRLRDGRFRQPLRGSWCDG